MLRGSNLQTDIKDLLFKKPIAQKVVRIPNCTTTVDGLFPVDKPLQPGKTIIVLDIGSAAKATSDDNFLFGTGVGSRQCPFKPVLYSFSAKARHQLR